MKMYKITLVFAVAGFMCGAMALLFTYNSSQQVYVDVNKLLDGYERTKVVRSEYESKAKTLQANVDSLLNAWQKEITTYEKERSAMSKKELELKQQLLSSQQRQISNYQQAIEQQLQEEDQKSTQTVINDINDYIKEFGERNGYRMIYGASGGGNIMYASDAADLTDEVLTGLNEAYLGQ